MTVEAPQHQVKELENSLVWAFREYPYHCQTIKDGRKTRFVFTHNEAANRAWLPAKIVRQFEFVDQPMEHLEKSRLFFEIDGIRFEPGTQATIHAIEFAKSYLDSRLFPVKKQNTEGK